LLRRSHMGLPVFDLHCDLLSYLVGERGHTPFDAQVHCSIPQLKAGNVRLQVMAIFTETKANSSQHGLDQAEVFKVFANQYSLDFDSVQVVDVLPRLLTSNKVGILAAIENASAFCEEQEPLDVGLERLRTIFGKVGRPLYVSLTWNSENRFGGGALTNVGLKNDGRKLIEFLGSKQIAVDISHASDTLAHDIFTFIDQNNLDVSVIASHSNVRKVCEVPRNLSDDLLQEIFKRQGLVGLNFVRAFLGPDPDSFCRQIEEMIRLGGEHSIAFGADFFYEEDAPSNTYGNSPDGWYFSDYDSSECYPRLLELFRKRLSLSDSLLANIAYQNAADYLARLWKEKESQVVTSGKLSP
ncbi:MAG: peptidase, partial [Nitrosomonas sp.]